MQEKVQEKAAARGPLVWRDMDQKTLDDAYDQLIFAPNRDLVLARNRRRGGPHARRTRRPAARGLRPERARKARHLPRPGDCAGAGQHLRARRRLAPRQRRRLRPCRRAAGWGRRARRHPRLHECRSGRRRFVSDVPAGQPRDRVGLRATPKRSAATVTGCTSPRIHPARISPPARCRSAGARRV